MPIDTREELVAALRVAAELEHGLMIQLAVRLHPGSAADRTSAGCRPAGTREPCTNPAQAITSPATERNHTVNTYQVRAGDTLFAIAEREYGDGGLFRVIAEQNHLADPDVILAGQELLIPYVTYRRFFATPDSTAARKQVTQQRYGTQDANTQLIWEIVNGVAQRPIEQGAWLLMPDLADVGHHTVVEDETFEGLAFNWYGDDHLAAAIRLANGLPSDAEATPGQVLIVPGLNRRSAVAGDTLASLCRFQYGDADLDTRIAVAAAANRIDDPDKLFANQVVYFPS